jgi:hypothetical protein
MFAIPPPEPRMNVPKDGLEAVGWYIHRLASAA